MKYQAIAILVLTITLALGLPLTQADEPQTRGEKGDILTPLVMGNAWVYESDGDELITTDRIEGVVLFDNKPWYLMRSYERQKNQPDSKNVSLHTDLWLARIDGHECDAFIETSQEDEDFGVMKLDTVSKYYRYPATLGETYKPNPDDQSIAMTVIALNEKVKTKAGAFDCIVYKETSTEDPDYIFTSYVAPGMGIVKTITTDAEGTYNSELISYTLVEEE